MGVRELARWGARPVLSMPLSARLIAPGFQPRYRGGVIDEPTAEPVPAESTRQQANSPAAEANEPGATEAKEAEKSPWDDPRLPWTGKPGKADIACWTAIVGSGVYLLAILPFRAALVGTHPVLGELANGATESVIAAAAFARVGKGSLVLAILAAFPGIMKFDPIWWWAGRLWGEKIVLLISGRRKAGPKYLARVRKWGWRFSWPAVIVSQFLPIPNSIIYVAVGSAGMSLGTFLVLDLIGTAVWVGLLIGLGYQLGQHAVNIAETISHYSLWVSLGLVALVLAGQYWGSWRRKS
jgi:membrane-associated protein